MDQDEVTLQFLWIFFLGSQRKRQVWIPDIELLEGVNPLEEMLSHEHAKIYSNGTVYLDRSGEISSYCAFENVISFPFDAHVCYWQVCKLHTSKCNNNNRFE